MPYYGRSLPSLVVLTLSVALGACGGRAVNKKTAHALVVGLPGGVFDKEDVDIESVQQTTPGSIVVETRLRTAFRFEKIAGNWQIREIRVGNHDWESLDAVVEALERVKEEETRRLLAKVAAALDSCRQKKGSLPEFKDYVALSDALHPDCLNPLIRLDAWQHPLAAFRASANVIRLLSAGRDGKLGTTDDIDLIRQFP